ncbi:MAG: DNA-processing protein DprA [Ruminococcus sp.]|nr:DNA-processing protein DprA [Ruminococcus sp.]
MLKYWLWMVMALGAGNPKIWTVIQAAETPERAYHILQDAAQQEKFSLTAWQKRAVRSVTMEQVEKVLENCRRKEISLTCYGDALYPSRLLEIYNPPAVLFYQGDIRILEEYPAVTVVGTRKPTEYSVRVADSICSNLARTGIVIVSGFAVGLDSAAHRAALLARGRTVAVLGCGIDVEYPKNNAGAKKYITKKGLLLTEFLPGTEPHAKNFPLRNRILSGVSLGVLVVQAPERSGSLITAELALEQGRNVFCIPPADLFDNQYAGVVKYLRDGAIPVFSYLDVVNEYYHSYTHKLMTSVLFESAQSAEESVLFGEKSAKPQYAAKRQKTETAPEERIPEEKQKKDKEETAAEETAEEAVKTQEHKDFSALDGLELQIAVLLSQEHQMHIDAIVERLGADESEVASALTELAISGYATRFSGQCYGIL